MHDIRAGTYRHQSGQRPVMYEAGVVPAGQESSQRAARQRHERIKGHQPSHRIQRLRRHDIEAEPADGEYPRA